MGVSPGEVSELSLRKGYRSKEIMSGWACDMKSPRGPSPTCPPQLLWKRIVLGQLVRTELNQLMSRVRVAVSLSSHSSPNWSATIWRSEEHTSELQPRLG